MLAERACVCKRGGPAFAIAVRDCHRFVPVMFRRNMMMLVPLVTSLILTKLFT